jgi:hypothetical protein
MIDPSHSDPVPVFDVEIINQTPITSWLDEACSRCPRCGWSDFPEEAANGECPDCGAIVIPPNDEPTLIS